MAQLTNLMRREITSYHEAGHACVMAMCGLPIVRFFRLGDGNAQMEIDQTYKAPIAEPEALKAYYARVLSIRASRYSQPLCQHNNKFAEIKAFQNDDAQIRRFAKLLFDQARLNWSGDQPSDNKFTIDLLAVADRALTKAYEDVKYVKFVRAVARAFNKVDSMIGSDVLRLVQEQWNLSGTTVIFSGMDEITTIYNRTPVDSDSSSGDGVTEEVSTQVGNVDGESTSFL